MQREPWSRVPEKSDFAQLPDWTPHLAGPLKSGLDTSKDSTDIEDTASPELLNVQFVRNVLGVDLGYRTYRTTSPLLGTPQQEFQFFITTGAVYDCLITTSTFYVGNIALAQWQFVGDGTIPGATLTAPVGAGGTVFPFSSVVGLANGDHIGIALDNSLQLQGTITNIAGNNVTLSAAVPVGRVGNNGASVVRAPVLLGNLNFQCTFVAMPALNQLIVTNGVDPVKTFDGVNLTTLAGLPNAPTSCRAMTLYHSSLLLIDTTENGTRFPQRVRVSNAGDPTNWATGVATRYDLVDTEDFNLQALALGPWLILYRETTIMRGTYTGDPTQLIYWEYTILGEGAISNGAVCDTGGPHIFFGSGNIYRYSGGYDLEAVGEKIFYSTIAVTGDLNPSAKSRIFSLYIPELDEAWFFYPSVLSSNPDTLMRFDISEDSWWKRQFADQFVGGGFNTSLVTFTWQTIQGTWLQNNFPWVQKVFTANSPITILCSVTNNETMTYDYISQTDNGTPISWFFITKDFQDPNVLRRTDSLRARGVGDGIQVDYSIDQGQTYISLGAFDFGTMPSVQTLTFQVVSQFVRFRFSGVDPLSKLFWFTFKHAPESAW